MSVIPPSEVRGPGTRPSVSLPGRVRLDYLDGLRGLAALYVVFHHAYMEVAGPGPGSSLPVLLRHVTTWLSFGQASVDIFIVLSGYCLMLPIARSQGAGLRGGIGQYFLRRAQRLLPPYYAALALAILLIECVPGVRHMASDRWPGQGPHFSPHVVFSHLLLIHNLSPNWAYKIDYPMWSVATEWQIYFLLPMVLLPLWRRLGNPWLIALSFGFGLGVHQLSLARMLPPFDQACPWFLGLFALGMAGAAVSVSADPGMRRLRENVAWGRLAAVSLLSATAAFIVLRYQWWDYNWVRDCLIGVATACLLIYCTRSVTEDTRRVPPLITRVFQSRPAVRIGVFSYSLYLIHAPLLALAHQALSPFLHSPAGMLVGLAVFGVPFCLGAAYLFFLAFERPFMPGRPKTERQAERAAITSPAP